MTRGTHCPRERPACPVGSWHRFPRSRFPRVHPPDPSSPSFLPPGVRKRSELPLPSASHHRVSSRLFPRSRNATGSGRSVVPVRVPATACRASTTRATPLHTPIQKAKPTRSLPFNPRTASPADQVNVTPPPCLLHKSPHPHHLIALDVRHLQVRSLHR